MADHVAESPGAALPVDVGGHRVVSHTFAYLLARGVPGIIAFLCIPVFTNLLEPAAYGKYALAVAVINTANSLLFQWIRLAMIRNYPTDPARMPAFTSTVVTLWLAIAVAVGGAIAVAIAFVGPFVSVLIVGWAVLVAQSLFDVVTEFLRACLRPGQFMVLQLIRAISLVGFGFVLLKAGVGWTSPLIAVAVGMLVAVAWAWRRDWRDARLRIDRALAGDMFRYGVPVSLTVVLGGIIFLTDRTMIALYLGNGPAGVYSAAFDFTSQTILLLMLTVSMAAFPIAVRALEANGVEAARQPMATNAALLLAVGVPATVGAGLLAPAITRSFFGDGYAASAEIIPIVALGTLLAGLKACHFDAALQFARRTVQQVWIVFAAAVACILLNLVMIPMWGLQGAAVASVLTFLLAMLLTAWWGRRHFPLPFPVRDAVLVVTASIVMGAALYPFRAYTSVLALALQIVGGVLVYCVVLVAVNCFGLRGRVGEVFGRLRRRLRPPSPTSRPERRTRP